MIYKTDIPVGNLKKIDIEDIIFDYYISDAGFVYKKQKDGTFHKLIANSKNRAGHRMVAFSICKSKKGRNKTKQYLVATLVLRFFIGGYAKRRHFIYKDGNKNNCCSKNLSWLWGFNGDVDLDYVRSIDKKKLNLIDQYAIDYLLSGDENNIYKMIESIERILYIESRSKGLLDYFIDTKDYCRTNTKKMLDSGRYKPRYNETIIRPIVKMASDYMAGLYRYNIPIKWYEESGASRLGIVDNMEIDIFGNGNISDGHNSIKEEISEMFNNLS